MQQMMAAEGVAVVEVIVGAASEDEVGTGEAEVVR